MRMQLARWHQSLFVFSPRMATLPRKVSHNFYCIDHTQGTTLTQVSTHTNKTAQNTRSVH